MALTLQEVFNVNAKGPVLIYSLLGLQLCMPFGTITNLLMMKQKNQAFVEFEKENAASVMLNYFSR